MTEGLDDSLDNRINSMAVFGDFIGDGYVSTDVNMTDIGTLPYLFAIGGIVSIPLFVSMFYLIISKFNVRKILLVLFIFTSKIVPANPFFWFYIAVIYYYDAGRPR